MVGKVAFIGFLLSSTSVFAQVGTNPTTSAGTQPTINDMINATNFVVANQCSGTLISVKYRLVLTNNHCLEGYVDKVEKDETGKDGTIEKKTREVYKDMELKQKIYKDFEEVSSTSYQAKILFHSPKFDLALLKMKSDSIPQTLYSHVAGESTKIQRGDKVYVVGNPSLLDANLNEGVISSVNRTLHWDEDNEDIHYYGLDAGVNPGNSGGALYNDALDLVGVPAAKLTRADHIAFAIPAETIRTFLKNNCYEDVYNDKATKDHAACEQDKLDKVNVVRVKAGLPPLEPPKDNESLNGDNTVIHAMHSDIKPEPKIIVLDPIPDAPKTASHAIMDWIDSFGWTKK